MDEKLTIFYNKRTGTIKEMCGGAQDMSWFGDEEEDYTQIFDFLVVDFDSYILSNFNNLIIKEGRVVAKEVNIPSKYL